MRQEAVVLRRRRQDWLADVDAAAAPDGARAEDRQVGDARRAALEFARATLAAQHGLTAGHSDEVGLLCEEIADQLGMEGWERANLLAAAQLHDIGKVGVPHEILNKPGPLTAEEWMAVREHTSIGQRIVSAVPELDEVALIVRHSHEHWDGSGYPDGLAATEIPLASRVILCVDAFHAMRADRPYRRGRSAEKALAELKANAGTQFDPAMVAALEAASERIRHNRAGQLSSAHALLRSRRVAALLLALAVGGSAFAAVRGDLRLDGNNSVDARVAPASCPPGGCALLAFSPLRPRAARSEPLSGASPGGGPAARHAARSDLRVAGLIEHRRAARRPARSAPRHHGIARRESPVGRRPASATPQSPAATPQPPAAHVPPVTAAPGVPKVKKPKLKKPKPRVHPLGGPPGLLPKPPSPRGNAYGLDQHR